jgi:hypothetical protein
MSHEDDASQAKLEEFTNVLATYAPGSQKANVYFRILQLLMDSALDRLARAADPDTLAFKWNPDLDTQFFRAEAAVKVCSLAGCCHGRSLVTRHW